MFYDGPRLHPDLRRVLAPHALPSLPFHLVLRPERFLPRRIRTFVDFCSEAVRHEPWLASPAVAPGRK